MAVGLEDLRVLQAAESIADDVWSETIGWDSYAKNVMGQQLCRAVDSIGANIAEAFGRYHYGEKIRFLYYARGSLFETKYWLNRAVSRQLISNELNKDLASGLNELGRQLNLFINQLKAQQRSRKQEENTIYEPVEEYHAVQNGQDDEFLSARDLEWLSQPTSPNPQSPIS